MQLHTYKAKSLADALRLVREELGPDASVLHTREVGGSLARWLGGRMIEVTASVEIAAPSRLATIAAESPDHGEPLPGAEHDRTASIPAAELFDYRRQFRADLFAHGANEPSLVEQLASSRSEVGFSGGAARFSALRRQLRQTGVSEATASRWLDRLEALAACDLDANPAGDADRLRQIVQADLPVRGPIRLAPGQQTVVALVGPTGVGKTTTLAKLAAQFCLHERRSVGLISTDTYRVAAAQQLRTYAELLALPLEIAQTPSELRSAIERLSACDLILIDTAGRSPRDAVKLQELRGLLAAAQPHEVHLVVSSAAGVESLGAGARAFAAVGANALILTKLDEAPSAGLLPEWLSACNLPLSYTTSGQEVPNDIQPASAIQLSKRMLNPEF